MTLEIFPHWDSFSLGVGISLRHKQAWIFLGFHEVSLFWAHA